MFFLSGSQAKSCKFSRKLRSSRLLTIGLVFLSSGIAGSAAVADTVTFTTDITGANVQIDVGNTQTYDFVINAGHTVNEIIGNFEIKRGQFASQDITFSVYDAFNGTAHVNGAFTPNGSAVGAFSFIPGDVPQQFTSEAFDIIPAAPLGPGNYSVALHSIAGGNGTNQYFFKNQGFSSTSNGTTISIGTTSSTVTPEPSALSALGIGMATVAFGVRRRRRK